MEYAPIVIPTLNRIDHLKRCIQSLARNPEAKLTELIIGVDYPPNEEYRAGYEEVLRYIENGIVGFKNVVIVKRDRNLGAINNSNKLIDFAFEKYNKCIFSEDDNEFAECFLKYMNIALEKYQNLNSVFAVYGFRPKVKGLNKIGERVFFSTYFSGYGVGLWREKEKELKETVNRTYIEELCCNRKKLKILRKSIPYAETYLCSSLLRKEEVYRTVDGNIPLIDTVRIIYSVVEEKYLVCCPISMVKNWGYDGSGTNCHKKKMCINSICLDDTKNFKFVFEENPMRLDLDYPLEICNVIPYVSARVRIFLWRVIAKRRLR